MNTSKRLELANLIALRLRGINIEDTIAKAENGDSDSDSAVITPHGKHINVGRTSRAQSDSNTDSEEESGGSVASDGDLPVCASSFRPEMVAHHSAESDGSSRSACASPLHGDIALVPSEIGQKGCAEVDGHDSISHDSSEDSEDEAASLGQNADLHDLQSQAFLHSGSALLSHKQSPDSAQQPDSIVDGLASPASSSSSSSSPSPAESSFVEQCPSSPAEPVSLASIEADNALSAATSPQPNTPVALQGDADSESSRLAQNREKEYEAKLIMQLSEDVTSKLVLNRGATFIKHGRSGDPHNRFVWVSSDFKRIHWGDADTRNSKFMRFEDVTDVQAGKNTAVFQRSYGAKFSSIPESMCFSVVSGARTLDLQADSVERRNFWVQNLFVLFDIERRKVDELRRQQIDQARDEKVAAHTSRWRAAFKLWETSKTKPSEISEITLAGVPSSLRSKVWPRAIGNQLQVTRQLYDIFKTHAKKARDAHAKGDSNAYVSHEASISVLYKDLPRTFAELGFFHNGGPLEQPLREVLESYIFFRPDVGYVQGMSFIAAMLLLYVEPFEAFVCFSNMMNSAHFLPFYSMDLQHIHAYVLISSFNLCLVF
jgi:hypothetical protein